MKLLSLLLVCLPLAVIAQEDAAPANPYAGLRFRGIGPAFNSGRVSQIAVDQQVGKIGGCHLFRHTVATMMLENGADIRIIQQMLGHVNLTTTELYTRVSINLLRQVYSATHPAAHLKRPETEATTARDAEAVAELFHTLAAEASQEDDDNDEETL